MTLRDMSAAITPFESLEEVQKEVEADGSDEKVIAFFSQNSEAADVLESLALLNIECGGGIGNELEELIAKAFSAGVSYARNNLG